MFYVGDHVFYVMYVYVCMLSYAMSLANPEPFSPKGDNKYCYYYYDCKTDF